MHQQAFERLPFVALCTTVLMVIRATPFFVFDHLQRNTLGGGRPLTSWISQLAKHLDLHTLPSLPAPYGLEYCQGFYNDSGQSTDSARVTPEMLYELAQLLGVLAHAPPPPSQPAMFDLDLPLLPFTYECPSCSSSMKYHKTGRLYPLWILGPSKATRVPVFAGECRVCHTLVYPDRYTREQANGSSEDIMASTAMYIQVGKGRYASRELAMALSTAIIHAHIPISTFATCWNSSSTRPNGSSIQVSHLNLWRLFLLHHALKYTPQNSLFILPSFGHPSTDDSDDSDMETTPAATRDDTIVQQLLSLFEPTPTGHYFTYHIPHAVTHRCNNCAHVHRAFRPLEGEPGCSDAELLLAHQNVISDPTRVVTSAVIDGIEKLGHKV